jgi:hypothetical protein
MSSALNRLSAAIRTEVQKLPTKEAIQLMEALIQCMNDQLDNYYEENLNACHDS